jgi:hypothetical protein
MATTTARRDRKPVPLGKAKGRAHAPSTPATAAAVRAQSQPGRIKVKCVGDVGYYGEERKRKGDIFTISAERFPADKTYNPKDQPNVPKHMKKDLYGTPHPKAGELKELAAWMRILPAGDDSPERTTAGPDALAQKMGGPRPDGDGDANDDENDNVLT